MKIKFTEVNNPPGKLADCELHFEAGDGALAGLKLIGFGIWERRGGTRSVTFPARQYSVNGERRSFALLRVADAKEHSVKAHDGLRDWILERFDEWRGEQEGGHRG
jgi:hypothetical protein